MADAPSPTGSNHPTVTADLPRGTGSIHLAAAPAGDRSRTLPARYRAMMADGGLDWSEHLRPLRRLGSGGQGVVFLVERIGSDGFRLPVALKVFSPERYGDDQLYDIAMTRMARVAAQVARIQQDHLCDVHNFISPGGVRVLEMEWVDGCDLQRLLTPAMLVRARERVGDDRWAYLNDVIVTAGTVHPRLKPGIAIAVLRDCLAALSALHRGGIVHGDVKPSNIMLKRTGTAKLIDIGAAFVVNDAPPHSTCTPRSCTVMASNASRTTTARRSSSFALRSASRVRTISVISTKVMTAPSITLSSVR